MFISIPTLIVLAVLAAIAFYVGQKYLPAILEHDHDAVMRLLTRMDNVYAKIVAEKAKMDTQRVNILTKISNAIKPATAPTASATAGASAAAPADAPVKA